MHNNIPSSNFFIGGFGSHEINFEDIAQIRYAKSLLREDFRLGIELQEAMKDQIEYAIEVEEFETNLTELLKNYGEETLKLESRISELKAKEENGTITEEEKAELNSLTEKLTSLGEETATSIIDTTGKMQANAKKSSGHLKEVIDQSKRMAWQSEVQGINMSWNRSDKPRARRIDAQIMNHLIDITKKEVGRELTNTGISLRREAANAEQQLRNADIIHKPKQKKE